MVQDGWSGWITLTSVNKQLVPDTVTWAVYRNRLVDSSGKPVAIRHPGGPDKEGIVYIGAAGEKTLTAGEPQLRKRFVKHANAHAAGSTGKARDKRLVRLWQRIRTIDQQARMEFQFMPVSSRDAAKAIEDEMLDHFRRRFGEEPDDLWCNETLHPSIQ